MLALVELRRSISPPRGRGGDDFEFFSVALQYMLHHMHHTNLSRTEFVVRITIKQIRIYRVDVEHESTIVTTRDFLLHEKMKEKKNIEFH